MITDWIIELASEDEKLAGSARRRLVARGDLAVEPLLEVLRHPKGVTQYRGALRAMGDIAASGAIRDVAVIRGILLGHLPTHDGGERRSIINCLGRLGVDSPAESALLHLWRQEKRDDQLRVLAAALGRVGGKESAKALESPASTAPLVLREVATARAAINSRQARASSGDGRVLGGKLLSGARVRLRCRKGLGQLLLKHLPGTLREAQESASGQIDGKIYGSLDSLLECRLWSEVVFCVATLEEAAALLRSLTEGAPTWRLEMPHASRGELLDFVRSAQTGAPDLPNSPSRAVWELRPLGKEIEVLPRFWRDTRFGYLREHIPAMTHAPLAAALAVLSEPRADDKVWDPFCGAGTELGERAKAGPYARLIGSDRDDSAVDAARKNLAGIGRLSLLTGDALALPFSGANVLLTNPPYGRKVQGGNPIRLLRMLLENASRQMRRGRMVFCSPMPEETWTFAQRLGWRAAARLDVSNDEHPLEAQLFIRD